jgi:hypothetical protein
MQKADLKKNETRSGLIGGCTGVRTPVGLGQQGCKGVAKKIKFRNMAQIPRFFLF